MIEEIAKVDSIDSNAGTLTVEVQRQSSCGACAASSGCGTAVIAKVLGRRRSLLRVKYSQDEQASDIVIGDSVVLGLPEHALIRGSLAVYAVPLLLMIGFAVFGDFLGHQIEFLDVDTVSVLFASIGMIIGVIWLRGFTRVIQDDEQYQPTVLRILSHNATQVVSLKT